MTTGHLIYETTAKQTRAMISEGASEDIIPEAIYGIGSVSKMFVAVAVLRLAQEGKLSLDDKVADYFQDVPESKVLTELSGNATIAELLSHRGGVPNIGADYAYKIETDLLQRYSFQEVAEYCGDRPEHGKTAYSNVGYMLLGVLIRRVEDRAYQDVIKEKVIDVLGLENTGYLKHMGERTDLVCPQFNGQNAKEFTGAGAGGGIFSSPSDLTAFVKAFSTGLAQEEDTYKNPLFEAKTITRMREEIPAGEGGFSLGFKARVQQGQIVEVGHGGAAPCYGANLKYFPQEEASRVILFAQDNLSGMETGRIAMELAASCEANRKLNNTLLSAGTIPQPGHFSNSLGPRTGFARNLT